MEGRPSQALSGGPYPRLVATQTLVIGYDGSAGADRAIDAAAALFPSAKLYVVAVVEPVLETVAGAEIVSSGIWVGLPEADEDALAEASQTAEAGAARASAAGLRATARPAVGAPVWAEVAKAAKDLRADAILVGSRGHGAVVDAFLGSVSHALARHAGRPVLVVPPPNDLT